MSSRAPVEAQKPLHRYIAVLFAVVFPALAVMEISGGDLTSPSGPIRWASYLVLGIWALYLVQSDDPNTLVLVITTMGFFGSLAIIEALFGVEVSAFDFATTFGLILMIGILAGTLTAGSRLVWAGAVALSVAVWSIALGVLAEDDLRVMAVRAVIAAAGVILTTVLVSKLFDELAEAIEKYDRSARLREAIARCSEALLVQTEAFAVYEAVKALLDASQADYAYVDRNIEVDGELGWEIVADAAKGVAGYGSAWKEGRYSLVPSLHGPLAAGRAVVVHTKDLAGEERALYEDDGIYSEAAVPIFVSGEFRGSIGFILYTHDQPWSDADIQTLWRASHMIGAYWRRQEDAEELRDSNESKERLLASVSHEIRTPLTAIVGLSEEIISSRTSLGDEELDELNGIIAVQSRELADLVDDLLVASRADGGSLSINPEITDLRDQAEKVLRGVQESHPTDKKIILQGEGVEAWADPLRVRQVIRNLLTNAIKYGGERIVLGVSVNEGRALVMVADDGVGVPDQESDLIFERYYRSAQSPTQPGSVGIGLAVSRQLADLMDGTLEYIDGESQHRFELSLPGVEDADTGAASEHEIAGRNT